MTLDNSDRALSYDADEVMVTRRYYRSGDSEYYINRQSARLRDIHEMFMDTGLGREGYSNIGQGRIDEILARKSADRREIFEEAAGISKYRHRKEETERKLANTEDNLLRIGDKISELELQVEPLRIQSEKAKKYLTLKEELQGVEVAVWMDRLEKLSQDAKKAEEDFVSASFVRQQAHDELEKLYASTETLNQQLRSRSEQVENLRVQVSMLEGSHQQIEGQIAVLEAGVKNNEENIRRNQEDMEGQADRSSGIAAQMEHAESRIGQIAGELEQKNAQAQALQAQLTQMTADAQGITRQFMQLRTNEVKLTADLASREADIRSLEAGMQESEGRAQLLQADLSSGEGRRQEGENALQAAKTAWKKADEEVTVLKNAIAGYTLRQATRSKRAEELSEKVLALRSTLDGVRAKLRVFKAMEQDFEGYQKSVRMVMQESKRGALRNIHGPVSQLIRTEDEYTVAVEIALGGAMQQIVVDTEQDGKAAIAFLKRTGGGRATFLPLSAIRGRALEEKGLDNCAGFVGIASALVQYDKIYTQVIENLLGRIVITENIDQAISMAKKYGNRFKIVTLDGQVINAGGSMTGGSVSREAGILSRANELEKLTRQEKELAEKLSKLEEEYTEARRSADQVEFQLTAAREQLSEQEKQALTLEGQVKQHEIWLQAINEAYNAARQEMDALERRRKLDLEQLAGIRAQIRVFGDQLNQTRQELKLLEGSQIDAEEQVAKITDDISAVRTEMAALEAERSTALNHIADLRVLAAAAQGDREKKLQDIALIRKDTQRLQGEIAALQQRQADNDDATQKAREQMQKALADYAQTEADRSKHDTLIQEKNKDLLKMESACALLENKKETTAIEEKNTIDRLWETYGLTPGTAQEKRGHIESVAAGTRRIGELKRSISNLGTPNLGAIEEYVRVNERYTYLASQRDDVLNAKKDLKTIIRDITQEMTTIFVGEFKKIDEYFGQTFQEMFGGGKGQLVLEDPNEPLSCGIEIRVQPPGKQLKTITLLSGGEKAFVALALYFAILKVRPTPFCMLDEIDAALDD